MLSGKRRCSGQASRKRRPFSMGTSAPPSHARCLSLGQWLGVVGEPLELARRFEQFAERSNEPDEAIDAFEAWLRQIRPASPRAQIAVQRRSSTVRTITRISRVATALSSVTPARGRIICVRMQ